MDDWGFWGFWWVEVVMMGRWVISLGCIEWRRWGVMYVFFFGDDRREVV